MLWCQPTPYIFPYSFWIVVTDISLPCRAFWRSMYAYEWLCAYQCISLDTIKPTELFLITCTQVVQSISVDWLVYHKADLVTSLLMYCMVWWMGYTILNNVQICVCDPQHENDFFCCLTNVNVNTRFMDPLGIEMLKFYIMAWQWTIMLNLQSLDFCQIFEIPW